MFGKCMYSIRTYREYHDRKDLNYEDRFKVVCALDYRSLSKSKTRLNSKTRYYDHTGR